ncbi:nudix hydrolase 24, chloroplastic-like [Varroa jacobsoni]|uniref:Nudix hydrolase domain-containing protein n=1 Tax=Varroa destructor TaxID=109461 RepID=A0A7M7JRT0_VARDE|nr:nudix hydrolase 24, chloroplastic-like [Varroa destructor]XP_022698751.1 nudix hydrolase 24, chloroplastic-like [Varroa jacobsoni]
MPEENSTEDFGARLETLLANFQLDRSRSLSARCRKFAVDGQVVGLIRNSDWELMRKHTEGVFVEETDIISLNPEWKTCEERTLQMAAALQKLREENLFPTLKGWRNETYDIAAKFGDATLMRMERSATCLFGTKRYGVHITGYVEDEDGRVESVWFQKRSPTKETWPNKIDIMVSGGLSSGNSVTDCLIREAEEEASMSEELVRRLARPVGFVSFIYEDERGIFPETIFCFDARLPRDFVPRASDCEVQSFHCVPVEDVANLVVNSDVFKLTSAPIALDFLVRHSILHPDSLPQYGALLDAIHLALHNSYPENVISTDNGHCI